MEIKTLEVAGFYPAIKGMRNAKKSWDKSDSGFFFKSPDGTPALGPKDLELAQNLIKAGGEHRKFLRMIQVWADFNMPRYWWAEMDTYHFNTKNSESTMHTIMHTDFNSDCFVYCPGDKRYLKTIVSQLKHIQHMYAKADKEQDFETKTFCIRRAKALLPEGFLQLRTVNTNYEELRNIYYQRKNHLLKVEWQDTCCKWIETLPYSKELVTF